MLPSKREASARPEDLFPLAGRSRRTERSVQTCGKPNALSSALYSRRVTALQDQVDRLQQRNVDVEEEHRAARQSFQGRLQELHESWQDCFDRHQHAWSQAKALAESAWAEERHHLQAQIMQLTSALAGQPSKELMEDAAVQAGSFGAKSRSSQTPPPSTPRPTRSPTDGICDLLRTQSLPADSQEWLGALVSSNTAVTEFGNAAADHALKVAEGSLSVGDYSQAASSFARAAALYAQGISQNGPDTADSVLSCSSSETSEIIMASEFFPLQEVAGTTEQAPVPDQSWWEEFGEWESASKTPSYARKAIQAVAPTTPTFTASTFTSQENLADNDDIWDDILQAVEVAGKPKQPEDTAFPVLHISLPKHAFKGDVTYTPVEAFQPLSKTQTDGTANSNIFSGTTGFPVSFSSSFSDDASSHVEVMDMSAGDLVSIGGPDSCPWDGSSSATQHITPSFPKSSLEERFAADLDFDSAAQHGQVADRVSGLVSSAQRAQMALAEQASQTVAAPVEQSMQSRRGPSSNGSLLSMHSVGQKRHLATLDELAGLLLPQSCRVAARVSTKLPPLDHDPMLPPLPEGFVLPPEMHPVVGTYRTSKPSVSSTGSQTAAAQAAANAACQSVSAAVVDNLQEGKKAIGKWLHPKQVPPRPKARVVGDLADQAAASMNMSTEELLAASPMTELLKDVLSYSPDPQQQDIDVPTFTSRLADSGFMTCQLAQILAPIRAASAPLPSSDNAPATPPQTAFHTGVSVASTGSPGVTTNESSTAAAAVADPALEARLEAAAVCLLAEIGIDCSSQPMTRADSDACSEFEVVPRTAADMEKAFSTESFGAKHWLGPAVQLVKTTSGPPGAASLGSTGSAAFYSPGPQSATPQSATPQSATSQFEREVKLSFMDDGMTSSTVFVEDVQLDVAGDESAMTIQAPHSAAECLAAVESSIGTELDDSASETGSYSDSDLSLVSASSFGDEEMSTEFATPDEWEMI